MRQADDLSPEDAVLAGQLARIASRLLGSFERCVLTAVAALGETASCAELSRHLSQKLGRDVSLGQTTRSLQALFALDLVTFEEISPTIAGKRQRSRKVYRLTPGGQQILLSFN